MRKVEKLEVKVISWGVLPRWGYDRSKYAVMSALSF